jgi:hypothetical protein
MIQRTVTVFVSLILFLAGCSAPVSAPEPDRFEAAVKTLSSSVPEQNTESKDLVVRLLSLNGERVRDAWAAFEGGDSANGMIVVQSADEDAALEASSAMEYYLTTLKNSAEQYHPEQVPILEDAYLYTNGDLSILVISDRLPELKQDLAQALH